MTCCPIDITASSTSLIAAFFGNFILLYIILGLHPQKIKNGSMKLVQIYNKKIPAAKPPISTFDHSMSIAIRPGMPNLRYIFQS